MTEKLLTGTLSLNTHNTTTLFPKLTQKQAIFQVQMRGGRLLEHGRLLECLRYIKFGTKLYRQIMGISMVTNWAPLVADLILFCYERDFMLPLSGDKDAEVIEAFNSTDGWMS